MRGKRWFAILSLASCVTFAAGCPVGRQRCLYSQSNYDDNGGFSELHYSEFFHNAHQIAETFAVPEADSLVTRIQWWGAYGDSTSTNDDFTIRIWYADEDMLPYGEPYIERRIRAVDRVETDGIFAPGAGDFTIYKYSAGVLPIRLRSDLTYFISILNDTGAWIWSSDGSPATGDSYSVRRYGEEAEWEETGLDWAFELWGYR